jgi:hypothetical protein
MRSFKGPKSAIQDEAAQRSRAILGSLLILRSLRLLIVVGDINYLWDLEVMSQTKTTPQFQSKKEENCSSFTKTASTKTELERVTPLI